MKIGSMVGNITDSFFKKPVTELYPVQKKANPERFRGKVFYNPEKCTGCQLCVKDCPAEALELVVIDRASKNFTMKYYADRCTFCGQCVESCRFNCITMSNEIWELASLDRDSFLVNYGKDGDVQS